MNRDMISRKMKTREKMEVVIRLKKDSIPE